MIMKNMVKMQWIGSSRMNKACVPAPASVSTGQDDGARYCPAKHEGPSVWATLLSSKARRYQRRSHTIVQLSIVIRMQEAHYCPAKQGGLSAVGTLLCSLARRSKPMKHTFVAPSNEVLARQTHYCPNAEGTLLSSQANAGMTSAMK